MVDKKIIEDINTYIDSEKDEMLAMLKKYIQFRSFNFEMLEEGQKSEFVECQKWVANVLEKTAYFDNVEYYAIEAGRPNVAAVRKGAGKGRSLTRRTPRSIHSLIGSAWSGPCTVQSKFFGSVTS